MRTSRLPRWVPFRPGAEVFSATEHLDMRALADRLRNLRAAEAVTVAATMLEMRVMTPPLLYRIPAWIAVKRGMPERMFWAAVLTHPKFGEKMTRGIINDAAKWAIDGMDEESPNTVGGFSQREVNFIAGVLSIVRGHREAMAG